MGKEYFLNKRFAVCIFLLAAAMFGILFYRYTDAKNADMEHGETLNGIPVSRMSARFAIDTEDINQLAGDADYVFVAVVMVEEGYEYKEGPYTNYLVRVIDNLKGSLKTDGDILVQKGGGLLKDGSMYELYEKDELPVVGETYIFYAYAQPDGSLLVAGSGSNKKIDFPQNFAFSEKGTEEVRDVLENIDEYNRVVEALDTQMIRERERRRPIYEADYR